MVDLIGELREARKTRLRELFEQGKSDREIAEALTAEGWPVTANAVRKARAPLKLFRPKGGYIGVPMDYDYVITEFKSRAPSTPEEIARVVRGISNDVQRHPDHVRRFLRSKGLIEPRDREIPEETLKQAQRLLDSGVPYPEVASEIGISRNRLADNLPGYGMSPQEAALYRQAKRLAERVGV